MGCVGVKENSTETKNRRKVNEVVSKFLCNNEVNEEYANIEMQKYARSTLISSVNIFACAVNKNPIEKQYDFEREPATEGREGIVQRGFDRVTRSRVAVKTFKPCSNGLERICLTTQIELLRKTSHPNIVKLIEVYLNHGRHYLVTEFAEKGDLFSLVNSHGKLSEWGSAYILKQILEGVHYLHNELHIVHGDLKLENVVLTSDFHAKIIDFGTAFEFTEEKPEIFTGDVLGTTEYMAQECWKGYHSPYSDMWAFGILACFLIFGQKPFDLEKSRCSLSQYEVDVRISTLCDNSKVSSEVKDFVQKFLRIEAKERGSASEMLHHPWIAKYSVLGFVL